MVLASLPRSKRTISSENYFALEEYVTIDTWLSQTTNVNDATAKSITNYGEKTQDIEIARCSTKRRDTQLTLSQRKHTLPNGVQHTLATISVRLVPHAILVHMASALKTMTICSRLRMEHVRSAAENSLIARNAGSK
jgi:hypothetical protein